MAEFQRAAQLQTAAAQQDAIRAQTQAQTQANEMQAMQLKDEQLRRSLAPQFVTKDANGKPTGFDNEGLYNAMLEGGADPMSITALRMKQVEMQKALLGLSDAQIAHQDKVNDELANSLSSVEDIQNKTRPKAWATPMTPSAVAGAENPLGPPVPGTGGMPAALLPNVPAAQQLMKSPAAPAPTVGAAPAGTPESLARPEPGTVPTSSEAALQDSAQTAPRPITPEAQKAYQKELIRLNAMGIPIGGLKPVLSDESDIDQARAELGLHKQALAEAGELAKTQEAAGKGAQAQAEAAAAEWKPAGEGTLFNIRTGQLVHGVGSPEVEAFRAFVSRGGDPLQFPAYKAAQVAVAEAPTRIATAKAEGEARANIEAQTARGSDAALATVPPHLVGPATAAATKAGEDYAQAQSVSQRLQAMMDAAKKGNVVSYQLIPQEGALQVTTSQGVHRINMAEIQNYGGGSLWQKMEGHIGGALTGESIPASVLNDMTDMQKIQSEGAQTKYQNALKTINQTYGSKFKPVEMDNIPRNNAPAQNAAPPSGKAVSLAAAKQLPSMQGKSDAEVTAAIEAQGHKVVP